MRKVWISAALLAVAVGGAEAGYVQQPQAGALVHSPPPPPGVGGDAWKCDSVRRFVTVCLPRDTECADAKVRWRVPKFECRLKDSPRNQ